MKTFEREIKNAIDSTERMSGYDSYDSAEGDLSYFEDSSADGEYSTSYADGSHPSEMISNEFIVQYVNTSTQDITAYIFGFNLYGGTTQYQNGASPIAVVTNLQTGTTGGYNQLVAQSQNSEFQIGRWRFQCTTPSQLTQTLLVNYTNANGITLTKPFNLSVLRDSYQQQSDILDATKPVTIDGNTGISFTLKGSATLTITMYPTKVLSAKAKLNGMAGMGKLKAPRLSGLNSSPVIIQTTQDVKSITK